jgi:CheY-like chemotaxis protein
MSAIESDARRIREAAERCARIVRTFLNMARAKPGERAAVQLNDLARAAVDILGYNLRSHGITATLALDVQLPTVMADGDQLGQVVLNLLVNAQQALAQVPQARRQIAVSTGVEQRRDDAPARELRVWLRVADQGPGVALEHRERLFEPYFTTKADGQGTGLGLAVSRSIARDHGGDLVIESSAQGASFRLSLPQSGQPLAADSEPAPLAEPSPGKARVLVVDDEPEIADLLRELLEGAGYDVMTAESGAVALALLDEAAFDAVVSDLHMPDVDGATLWREIKARWPALARRVLFVTGDTLSPSVRQFLDDAHCGSLAKPFTKSDLLLRIEALLSGS